MELYVAHVLGPQGSAKLIDAVRISPTASAPALFPDAAASNRHIFYRGARAATVTEVYANLTAGPGGAPAQIAPPPSSVGPDQGFIQYASARRQERLQQQQEMVDLILRGPEPTDDVGMSVQAANSMFSTEMLRALLAGFQPQELRVASAFGDQAIDLAVIIAGLGQHLAGVLAELRRPGASAPSSASGKRAGEAGWR